MCKTICIVIAAVSLGCSITSFITGSYAPAVIWLVAAAIWALNAFDK